MGGGAVVDRGAWVCGWWWWWWSVCGLLTDELSSTEVRGCDWEVGWRESVCADALLASYVAPCHVHVIPESDSNPSSTTSE